MNHLFVAGFDFGTSYSKVVVRDQLTGLAKAVTFGEKERGLLPSFVSVKEETILSPLSRDQGLLLPYPKLIAADAIAREAKFSAVYGTNLSKVERLLNAEDPTRIALLVLSGYFLSVLQAIHQFIPRQKEWATFEPDHDHVVTQLAVPTGLMNDQRDRSVEQLMRTALKVATHLHATGISAEELSIHEAATGIQVIESLSKDEAKRLDQACLTYPEVAAGVQTVLRSRNTPDGKYITLDVGAGTIDLNAFYRRTMHPGGKKPSENAGLDYWACEVAPLGIARLNLGREKRNGAQHEVTVSPLQSGQLFAQMEDAIADLMDGAFKYQPSRIHGSLESPWKRGTYTYAWGGGASYPPYLDTLKRALNDQEVGVEVVNKLPSPSDQFELPRDIADFGRLAIAYGLSYHKANLDNVTLPHKLRTFAEDYPDYWSDTAPHREVCNCYANPTCFRCGGTGFIERRKVAATSARLRPNTLVPSTRSSTIGFPPEPPTAFRTTKSKKKKTPAESLEQAVKFYNAQNTSKHFLIAERALLLRRICSLLKRVDQKDCSKELLNEAERLMRTDVTRFKGIVRVAPLYAAKCSDGVRVTAILRDNIRQETIIRGTPSNLLRRVNRSRPAQFIEILCQMSRPFDLVAIESDKKLPKKKGWHAKKWRNRNECRDNQYRRNKNHRRRESN